MNSLWQTAEDLRPAGRLSVPKCASLCLLLTVAELVSQRPFAGAAVALDEANRRYELGEFDSAREGYLLLINEGWEDPLVFYNFGNASFRSGRIGEAIWGYEKTLRIAPGNQDATHNLKSALAWAADREIPPGGRALVRRYREARALMLPDAWLLLGGILFFASGVGAAASRFTENWMRGILHWGAIVLIILSVGAAAIGGDFWRRRNQTDEGIIVSSQAGVRADPSAEGRLLLIVAEGSRVRLRAGDASWITIVLSDGTVGWVKRNHVRSL